MGQDALGGAIADVTRSEIDGIPVVWAPAPEPFAAGIIFRVGHGDERLALHGITHLAEHLALTELGHPRPSYNGFVDVNTCSFVARGSRDEVLQLLANVCRSLQSPPLDRFEKERQVLKAEEVASPPGPLNLLLALRYGANGPGLSWFHQFALDRLDATDQLTRWARSHFTRGNCAIWMTSEPPPDLGFELPEGERKPTPEPAALPVRSPSVLREDIAAAHITFEAERSPAMWLTFGLLGRRLNETLRQREGLVYNVQPLYLPLSATRAFASISASATRESAAQVTRLVLSELESLAADGFSEEEIERGRDDASAAQSDPMSLAGMLMASASGEMIRGFWESPQEIADKRKEVDGPATAAAIASLLPTRISIAPELRDDEVPYGPEVDRVLYGDIYYPKNPLGKQRGNRLLVGSEGIAYQRPLTNDIVFFDELAATFSFSDGRRSLWRKDGSCVDVAGREWSKGKKVVNLIDLKTEGSQVALRDDAYPVCIPESAGATPLPVPNRLRRLAGRAIDTALLLPIWIACWSKAGELNPGDGQPDDGTTFVPRTPEDLPTPEDSLASLLIVVPFLLFVAYEVLTTAVLRQSLGKWLMQIRVIDRATGAGLTLGKALGRAVVLLVSAFPLVAFWQLSSIFKDSDRRGIHDDAANSVVVTNNFSKKLGGSS